MATGPSLVVRLGVSGLSGVQTAFAKVQTAASGLAANVGKAAIGAAAAVGIGFSIHKLESGIEKVVEMGAELGVLSKQIGVPVSNLVAFRKAMKEAGLDAADLGKDIRLMSRSVGDAALNGGAAAAGIERLGLNVGELAAMRPDEQFVTLAKRIGAIENPTIRAATALDIFGRTGTDLLPLFQNDDLLKGITEGAGEFGAVMERNAHRFHDFELALRKIPTRGTQFFAGIADFLPFDDITAKLNAAIKAVDFLAIGQKVGAFVDLAIQEWKAGRFGELIALTIEAGFEAGGLAARVKWDQLFAWIATPAFWAQVADAALTAVNSITQGVISTIAEVLTPLAAGITWLADQWRFAYANVWEGFKALGAEAINWIADRLEKVLKVGEELAKRIPGLGTFLPPAVQLPRVEPVLSDVAPPSTWSQAMAGAGEARNQFQSTMADFFRSGTAAGRDVLGTSTGAESAGNALATLNQKINDIVAARAEHEHHATEAARAGIPVLNARLELGKVEKETKASLLAIEDRRARVEGDFSKTAADKWRLKRASLEEEKKMLEGIVAALRERARLETDPGAREQILTKADTYESKLGGVNRGLATMGPDPYSTGDQMQAAITGLEDQFGTTAQGIARSFTSVIGSAVDSVSQGIEGLIMGTMTWSDALRNVARTMLTSVVQAISRMFAEWIAKRALAAIKNMLFSEQEGATDAAAKAPGALMSSISSYGIAAAIGLAALIAAMAAIGGGFKAGGYTGDGSPDAVAGVVHRGEFVVPASAVDRIGVRNLEAMLAVPSSEPVGLDSVSMRSEVVPASVSVAAPNVNNSVKIAAFDSRADAARWANSQDGETWFVDMARRTQHRWGRS